MLGNLLSGRENVDGVHEFMIDPKRARCREGKKSTNASGGGKMRANQRLMSGLFTVDRFGKLANNTEKEPENQISIS